MPGPRLVGITPGEQVFRLARGPDPWAWPDWTNASPDGTFGNRYDDPQSDYRVLYASTHRLATFVECLARFRPDPAVVAGMAEIDGDAEGALEPGQVPRSWLRTRRIGTATLGGEFADVGHSESLQWLRLAMAAEATTYGLEDLDAAAIRLSVPREFTQRISRLVYEQTEAEARRFGGIRYLSRLGDDFENWAIFEGTVIDALIPQNLFDTDPDLHEALRLLGLSLVGG